MKSGSPSRTTAAHKTQTKIQAWSSLVFHCCHSSFNPSEPPPWDSRPVSGAGVVHYQLLHQPRSVPTALGPAPLVTKYKLAREGEKKKEKDEDFEKVKDFFFLRPLQNALTLIYLWAKTLWRFSVFFLFHPMACWVSIFSLPNCK